MTRPIDQAVALHQAGKFQQAAKIYQSILASDPNNASAMHLLGVAAFQMTKHDQAVQLIERAIALDPNQSAFHHNLASTYRVLGRFQEAEQLYRNRDPPEPKNMPKRCSTCRPSASSQSTTRQMSNRSRWLLNTDDLSDIDRCFLHFAAGKLYDDMRLYDEAFPHYQHGNECRGADFDIDRYRKFVTDVIEVFSAERLTQAQGKGNPTRVPIFIVVCLAVARRWWNRSFAVIRKFAERGNFPTLPVSPEHSPNTIHRSRSFRFDPQFAACRDGGFWDCLSEPPAYVRCVGRSRVRQESDQPSVHWPDRNAAPECEDHSLLTGSTRHVPVVLLSEVSFRAGIFVLARWPRHVLSWLSATDGPLAESEYNSDSGRSV